MTLLFIRQQGNGPERNANLTPRGIFPAGASADGDAPREKGCRIRSGPLRKLLVRIEALAVQRRLALRKQRLQRFGKTLQRLEVRADPLVMLRNQFIAHFPSV